jgi:hypothetical protein
MPIKARRHPQSSYVHHGPGLLARICAKIQREFFYASEWIGIDGWG